MLFLGTHEQQQQTWNRARAVAARRTAPPGRTATTEDAYRDWNEVLAHSYNTWGRKFEFEVVTPTGADEAAQRADALNVAEKKPFAVIVTVPSIGGNAVGAGQVFAADLVAKKIIVFYGGVTNAEAEQAGAVPVARRHRLERRRGERRAVRGAPAARARPPSGRATSSTRSACSARSTPSAASTGSSSRAPRRRKASSSPTAPTSSTRVPLDTSQTSAKNQEEAPILTAKLKDAGVTTVMLYASYTMTGQIFKAADSLDYHPEWIFPGYARQRHRGHRADQQRRSIPSR